MTVEITEKKLEAALVKKAYLASQDQTQLTQASVARLFGVTQGLVQAWFSGATRIPDSTMFQLSQILKFDPLEVRPSLCVYLVAAKQLIDRDENDRSGLILTLFDQMNDEQKDQLEQFAKFVVQTD